MDEITYVKCYDTDKERCRLQSSAVSYIMPRIFLFVPKKCPQNQMIDLHRSVLSIALINVTGQSMSVRLLLGFFFHDGPLIGGAP